MTIPALGIFRTNGRDSVWAYDSTWSVRAGGPPYDFISKEVLWMTFSDFHVGDRLNVGCVPLSFTGAYFAVRGVDTTGAFFVNGLTRVFSIESSSMAATWDVSFDEHLGLIDISSGYDFGSSSKHLVGALLDGVMFGRPSGVAESVAAPSTVAVSVYPTPARDIATLAVDEKRFHGSACVTLTDMLGRVVWTGTSPIASGRVVAHLDVRALPAGVYIARATSGGASVWARILVGR